MKSIVIADRRGRDLGQLCSDTCPALLQVAGKPLLEHSIDDLAQAGIGDITVVVCDNADAIRNQLGDGARWGVSIRYAASRGEESVARIVRREGLGEGDDFLCLRGDVLRSAMLPQVLEALAGQPGETALRVTAMGRNAWIMRARTVNADFSALDWNVEAAESPVPAVNVAAMSAEAMNSDVSFFLASLRAAGGLVRGLVIPGFATSDKLRLGRFSRAPEPSRTGRRTLVGNFSNVHESVTTGGIVVVGDNCFVDAGTHIADSIVLPGTYVGRGLDVRNCIVGPDFMMRMDMGLTVPVSDPVWVAPMNTASRNHRSGIAGRAAALALLVLSLPLWPLAALLAFIASPRGALQRRALVGNRRDAAGAPLAFDSFEFATAVPVLRRLPLLWSAVRGDLRLFGARPRAVGVTPSLEESWSLARAHLPAGVLGPHQLHLDADAPEEEVYVNEVVFTSERGFLSTLRRLGDAVGALFSNRAWLPRATA